MKYRVRRGQRGPTRQARQMRVLEARRKVRVAVEGEREGRRRNSGEGGV
jgi:hypothetical protein